MSGFVGTTSLGTISTLPVDVIGVAGTSAVGSVTISESVTTYTVTVASYLGANKYYIDGVQQATVELIEGNTYRFNQSDISNRFHPLKFSETSDGTHGGGNEYTTGVTTSGTQVTKAVLPLTHKLQ